MSVLVVTPTYQERESLPETLRRLRAAVPSAHVLVVDDNSPDGTGAVADELAARDPAVHVLHRPGKDGLGAAYVAGFAWGLERGYDVLVQMDADGSHQPEQMPALLTALAAGADLVIGSRWVRGGKVVDWPRRRQALSRGGNAYARLVMDLPVADATGGYRAVRAAALHRLDLGSVNSHGYCFQVDVTSRALRAGLTVTEVPITFVERTQGASKMSRAIVAEALWRTTAWGVSHRVGRLATRMGARRRTGRT